MVVGGGFDKERSDAEPCVKRAATTPKRIRQRFFDYSVAQQTAKNAIDRNGTFQDRMAFAAEAAGPPRKNQKWWWEVDSNHRKRS